MLITKKNFMSEHSIMVGYLSVAILSQTSYSNDSNSIKLSLAALLHDVGIKNEKHWAYELGDNLSENYSRREIDSFYNHIQASLEVLSKINDVPPDVDKILINHHEKYDGSGYPRGIGWSKIPILSCIFIVAHELVVHIFNTKYSDEDLSKFIAQKKIEYVEGHFRDAIIALEKIR
jgi:putative nucleotidyltransferase with HDIG domain